MTSKLAAIDLNECLDFAVQDKNLNGKACTCCHQWRSASEFHQNKSKADGLESHCKVCVSVRKKARKRKQRQLERKTEQFESVIIGSFSDDRLDLFAEIFGAAIKEVYYDETKTEIINTH